MIEVGGLSQGIGFRPLVYGLAHRLELAGSVRNRAGGVAIEIEGAATALNGRPDRLAAFETRLAALQRTGGGHA